MALGFSNDRRMEFSDVVGCDKSDASTANAKDTYNVAGFANTFDTDQSALSNFSFSITGDIFSCQFDRTYLSPPNAGGFALNGTFTLLLGARNGGVSPANSRFEMHTDTPCISSAPVNLLVPNPVLSSGRDFAPVKAHGLLMVLAWQVLIVTGIFMASYTKYIFPNGEWFQAHRFLNGAAIIIAIIAFILIFVTVGGLSSGSVWVIVHQVFAIAAMIFMLANPVLAIFRCRPKANFRWIFNLLHSGIGWIAIICASVAMETGFFIFYEFRLPAEGGPRILRSYGFWVFITWIISIWFFYVPLIVYRIYKGKKLAEENKAAAKTELPEKNPLEIILHNITGIPLCPPWDERKSPAKEFPVILTVMISFIVYNAVFYIACVIALALA